MFVERTIQLYRNFIDGSYPKIIKKIFRRIGFAVYARVFENRHKRIYKYILRPLPKIKLSLWLDWQDYTDATFLAYPVYEPDLVYFAKKILDKDSIVFDVGANVGYFSCIFAALGGRVFSIEASPRNVLLLRKNIEENFPKKITLLACAVAGENEPVIFKSRILNSGSGSSVGHFGEKDPVIEEFMETHTISGKRLDTLFEENKITSLRLLKIDVQGAEFEALVSLESQLKDGKVDYIVIEYNANTSDERIDTFFKSVGYSLFELLDDGSLRSAPSTLIPKKNYVYAQKEKINSDRSIFPLV